MCDGVMTGYILMTEEYEFLYFIFQSPHSRSSDLHEQINTKQAEHIHIHDQPQQPRR